MNPDLKKWLIIAVVVLVVVGVAAYAWKGYRDLLTTGSAANLAKRT